MNEAFKEQLLQLVDKAKQVGGDTIAFIQAQAPELVKEILRWQLVSNAMMAIAGLFTLIALIVLCYKCLTKWDRDFSGPSILVSIASLFAAPFLLYGLCHGTINAVQVLVAPRLVLLEMLAHLIRK